VSYLYGANLYGANLDGANLAPIRDDYYAVLLAAIPEIPALREAIIQGHIDGTVYQGECACLVGTIANAQHRNYQTLENITPNGDRPIERFFYAISKGDTPETSQFSKLALEWLDEFQAILKNGLQRLSPEAKSELLNG
jgi:hypothetical protein